MAAHEDDDFKYKVAGLTERLAVEAATKLEDLLDFYIDVKTTPLVTSLSPPLTVGDLVAARRKIVDSDVEYVRQKLFRALAVPPSFLRPPCERGPGIAALKLTPKRDNTVWVLDEDLLCADAD